MTIKELIGLIESNNVEINVETADGYKLTASGVADALDEEIEHIYLDGLTIDLKRDMEDIFPNALDEEIEHIYLDGLTIDLKRDMEDIFPNANIETTH